MILLHTRDNSLMLFIGENKCLAPTIRYKPFSSSKDVDYFKNHINNSTIGPNELMEWLE